MFSHHVTTLATSSTLLCLVSCGLTTSTDSRKAALFGDIPALYLRYEADRSTLNDELQSARSATQYRDISYRQDESKRKLRSDLETAAAAWSGTQLDLATDDDLTILAPVTATFDGFFTSTAPLFALTGEVETLRDIIVYQDDSMTEYYKSDPDRLCGQTLHVAVVGLDGSGKILFSTSAGRLPLTIVGNSIGVPAGSAVEFELLIFGSNNARAYIDAVSLKLIVNK